VDLALARDRLAQGLWELNDRKKSWDRRQAYFEGDQDLPFAPEGVNQEYLALRKQAIANWLGLVMTAPIQRVKALGFRTGRDQAADSRALARWQYNKMDSRQRSIYEEMMVHGRGIASVWPNISDRQNPIVRPECGRNVHLEMDSLDPWTVDWSVKRIVKQRPGNPYGPTSSGIVLPDGTPAPSSSMVSVAYVYDDDGWARFEAQGNDAGWGGYKFAEEGTHPLQSNPFVPFDLHANSRGRAKPAITHLMPAQDALNTIRFNTLLAMQFSAYRQRVFTGYDPVLRDENGDIVWTLDTDGQPKLDANGQRIPVVVSPGRFGVDRAIVFPGADTKVFDLQESNLQNYITVLGEFLSELFAVGQVPPQYLLTKMANLSGDALTGAESTLQALIDDIQTCAGESNEHVMQLTNRAAGEDEADVGCEVIWADAEARSFAQVVDGITKLATSGMPKKAWFPMVPNSTPAQVQQWLEWKEEEDAKAAAQSPTVVAADLFRKHQEQQLQLQQGGGSPDAVPAK
jgi:hypothetical protein